MIPVHRAVSVSDDLKSIFLAGCRELAQQLFRCLPTAVFVETRPFQGAHHGNELLESDIQPIRCLNGLPHAFGGQFHAKLEFSLRDNVTYFSDALFRTPLHPGSDGIVDLTYNVGSRRTLLSGQGADVGDEPAHFLGEFRRHSALCQTELHVKHALKRDRIPTCELPRLIDAARNVMLAKPAKRKPDPQGESLFLHLCRLAYSRVEPRSHRRSE